jgi:hypothetical protein
MRFHYKNVVATLIIKTNELILFIIVIDESYSNRFEEKQIDFCRKTS